MLKGPNLPRPPIDLHQKVREVLQHTSPLLPQADCPIEHFERAANTGVGGSQRHVTSVGEDRLACDPPAVRHQEEDEWGGVLEVGQPAQQ